MIGKISVPEVQIPEQLRIMDPGIGLDMTVDPATGEVLKKFILPEAGVEWVEQGEEGEPANFSNDDERKPPELLLLGRLR